MMWLVPLLFLVAAPLVGQQPPSQTDSRISRGSNAIDPALGANDNARDMAGTLEAARHHAPVQRTAVAVPEP